MSPPRRSIAPSRGRYPPVDLGSRTARLWRDRCRALREFSEDYEKQFGKTAFSVLQAASQWARDQARTSPIQRHSYERRCGEMLETLAGDRRWPNREETAQKQIDRIRDWCRTTCSATWSLRYSFASRALALGAGRRDAGQPAACRALAASRVGSRAIAAPFSRSASRSS